MSQPSNPDLDRIGARLAAERPIPNPGFRGELRRSLVNASTDGPPPRRLRLLIAAYAGSGAVLLAIVAVGVAGLGPLSA